MSEIYNISSDERNGRNFLESVVNSINSIVGGYQEFDALKFEAQNSTKDDQDVDYLIHKSVNEAMIQLMQAKQALLDANSEISKISEFSGF